MVDGVQPQRETLYSHLHSQSGFDNQYQTNIYVRGRHSLISE